MKALIVALLLGSALVAQAPKAYKPNPKAWRLEVKGAPGGWLTDPGVRLEIKVVDPNDPDPPKDEEDAWVDPDLVDESAPMPEEPTPQRPWRSRKLVYWFNGLKQELGISVGSRHTLFLNSQNGENRLELWQPDANRRVVRTWWVGTTRTRLAVRLFELGPDGKESRSWMGGLQIVEPDHTESIGWEPTPSGGRNHGNRYEHATPLPGTYTVRWFDSESGVEGYEWGGGYQYGDKRPRRIVAEISLDGGTEFERRWRFERFVMPGTRRITLGSFDVED